MTAKVRTAVVGATGYAGLELTRLLVRHPRTGKPLLLRGRDGERQGLADLAEAFPGLAGNGGYPVESVSWEKFKQRGVDLLFLATPHEISRALVPEAVSRGLRVVDLSGAWRLKEEANRAVYGFEDKDLHAAAELTKEAVYGLPELNGEEISNASVVANPGCYATSVILALAPLLRARLVDKTKGIISDSKSGVPGAGKAPTSRTPLTPLAHTL